MFYLKYFSIFKEALMNVQRHRLRSFRCGVCAVSSRLLDDTVKMDIQLLVHEPHAGG